MPKGAMKTLNASNAYMYRYFAGKALLVMSNVGHYLLPTDNIIVLHDTLN